MVLLTKHSFGIELLKGQKGQNIAFNEEEKIAVVGFELGIFGTAGGRPNC